MDRTQAQEGGRPGSRPGCAPAHLQTLALFSSLGSPIYVRVNSLGGYVYLPALSDSVIS